MIEVRTRDFIHTKDDLYFASTNYLHPNNRIISFLRYIPNPNGDREKNGKKYSKVNSKEAFDYLKENKDRIVGLFITHGHDNQVGAITDILDDIPDLKIYKVLSEFFSFVFKNK